MIDSADDPSLREFLSPSLESPARGLSFAGSRAMLYSQVAIDMLRRQLVSQVGEDLARSIVAQSGRQAGFNDAQLMLQEREFTRVQTTLEMQYGLLGASGFGQFDALALDLEIEQRQAYVHVRCTGSPEAESHVRLFGRSEVPACWHLVGYSTGWVTAMTGLPLLTIESRCTAKGDICCEFETLPYDDFVGPEAGFWKRVFESTSTSVARGLEDELVIERETLRQQERVLEQLSAPLLQVTKQILVLPIIGAVDDARVEIMSDKLLRAVVERSIRGIILDVTGMEIASGSAGSGGPKRTGRQPEPAEGTKSASRLLRMARAVKLLGAQLVMTGISPAFAGMLAARGFDTSELVICRTLQDGIRELERTLRS